MDRSVYFAITKMNNTLYAVVPSRKPGDLVISQLRLSEFNPKHLDILLGENRRTFYKNADRLLFSVLGN